MTEPTEFRILILTDRRLLGLRWAEMLRPLAATVWLGREQAPANAAAEVIVADTAAEVTGWSGSVLRIGGLESGFPEDVGRSGHDCGLFCLSEDVTARELQMTCRLAAKIACLRWQLEAETALRHHFRDEALTDPLTGLPNRRAWDDVLRQRLATIPHPIQRQHEPPDDHRPPAFCLAILDIDHFKRVNETHGHAVGDDVLRQTGRAISNALRQEDFVARLGGDEFGLLLHVPEEAMAYAIVERVRTAISFRPAPDRLPIVTASAGFCATCEDESSSSTTLYAAADAALRWAKRNGRNQTQCPRDTPPMDQV